jgi:hypothetical protein
VVVASGQGGGGDLHAGHLGGWRGGGLGADGHCEWSVEKDAFPPVF